MYCWGRAAPMPAMLKWFGLVTLLTAGWMGC